MKILLARPLITLVMAASVVLLAGCLEQTRNAAKAGPAAAPAAPPAAEPEIISRPDPAGANVSVPVAEVARLHLSGLDETVIKAFVEKSTNAVSPTADDLIYLRDIGVSPRVITAMIQQTARMREQAATAAPGTQTNVTATVAGTNAPAAPTVPVPGAAPAGPPAAAAPAPAPQVVVVPVPADLPPQVNVFYQQLQPYGTWMQIADYGWCWQPSVVVSTPSWRPYADRGRWLYTDHGWYWQSDYAWGWAPFHYGRWVHHTRSGWLWVPDTTWGPAWVVWRSSDTHCGWAPLPPSAVFIAGRGLFHGSTRVSLSYDFDLTHYHYTFVPFSRFCDRNPYYYALAPTVVQNVYHHTTVINRIHVENNVIVNGGVNVDRVSTLTRSEIRKVSVREAAPQGQTLARLDKLEKSGDDLVIYRPALNPNAPIKPMTVTNSKGETRTELVPAGTLSGQKITGRPVYDTSTGVPVLTGYTTEPLAKPAGQSTVIINNNVTTTSPASPAPAQTTGSSGSEKTQSSSAGKVFGLTPNSGVVKRTDERTAPAQTVILPSPSGNSLVRPLTPPAPVTSTPRTLTPAQPVASSPAPVTPAPPVSNYQSPARSEGTKPSYYSTRPASQPPSSTPVNRTPAPSTPTPTYSAPAAPTYTPPAYTPPAPRPTYTAPAPEPRPTYTPPAYTPPPPRPTYTPPAPAPEPRPTYNAPAYTAPPVNSRATVFTPAPSAPAPEPRPAYTPPSSPANSRGTVFTPAPPANSPSKSEPDKKR